MKPIQKIGLGIFIASLLVFILSLGASDFKLTEGVFDTIVSDSAHNADLKPAFAAIFDKEYTSKFAFVGDIKDAVNGVNDAFKEAGTWDKVIWTNYTFPLVKDSSTGFLINWLWPLFLISFVLSCIGALMYIIPRAYEGPAGIRNNHLFSSAATNRGWIGLILGVLLILFYIFLYKMPWYITNWVILVDPLSQWMKGVPADQWFLYGLLYTLGMIVMGVRMFIRYRHNMYQMVRTGSILFFQTAFAFTIPAILKRLSLPSYDLKSAWPLEYTFFFDYRLDEHIQNGSFGIFMLGWGIVLFVIGVPLFTYFYGKRWYCSWVCGCGGLAETVGDPYRHLSDKSVRAWKFERIMIHSVLVFAVIMTIAVVYTYVSGESELFGISSYDIRDNYGFYIGFGFAGVIGTGFYPILGNRSWCRFGCPLAAYLGIIQRFKSRFRITTNGGQCISCGNCSTYCEMGIDVRAYAQRGQDIIRSSCVGCGICSAVCPRGVLKLENGPTEGRINDNPIIIGHNSIELNPALAEFEAQERA